jgi:hypothetical protein
VGEEFFPDESKKSFLVENFLDSPLPDCVDEGVGAGGEMVFEAS